MVLDPDGTITFTPAPGFNGDASFTYTVTDGQGGTDTALVTVFVNAPPEATNDGVQTGVNTPITFPASQLSHDDSDPDGDPLTVVSVQDAHDGTVTLNPDGTVTFTPSRDFTGTATFTYTITDGRGGFDTAKVFVHTGTQPGNNDPVSEPDKCVILHDRLDGKTLQTHAATDIDGDTLTYTIDTVPPHSMGALTLGKDGHPVTAGTTLTEAEYLSLHFDPAFGAAGQEFTLEYTVEDGRGGSDTGTMHIRLFDANDPAINPSGCGEGHDVITGVYGDDILDGGNGNDFLKSGAGDDTLIGGNGDDDIYGGGGNDISIGGAGADLISSGDGDDTLIDDLAGITDLGSNARIAGGPGHDTLEISGHNQMIDLTTIDDSKITGIEAIDLGSGNNAVKLDIDEILNLSSTTDTLIVKGGSGDAVQADLSGAHVSTNAAGDTIYAIGGATLVVESSVDQTAIIT